MGTVTASVAVRKGLAARLRQAAAANAAVKAYVEGVVAGMGLDTDTLDIHVDVDTGEMTITPLAGSAPTSPEYDFTATESEGEK